MEEARETVADDGANAVIEQYPARPKHVWKIGYSIREMIETAVVAEGGVDYFRSQARDNPTAFMALVGKIVPRDVNLNANVSVNVRETLVSQAVGLMLGKDVPEDDKELTIATVLGDKLRPQQSEY